MTWAPDYITRDELKLEVGITPGGTDPDDARLDIAITSASRAVDLCARRQFGKVASAEQRYYDTLYIPSKGYWRAEIDDLYDATGLAVTLDGVALTSANWILLPRNALVKGMVYTHIALLVCGAEAAITTDKWGWSATPIPVKQGTLTQASRFYKDKDAPFGIASSPDNPGGELRLLARVHPDVELGLRKYRRDGSVG